MFNSGFSKGLKNVLTAGEFFSAAFCNMNCKYCYIPKTEGLKEAHRQIEQALDDGTFIEVLKKVFENRLTSLSFWGTEPTLTLAKITKQVPELFKAFPELKQFDFSTNLLSHHRSILEFADQLEEHGEKIKFSFQVSLDGPPEITDYNRHPNSTALIIKHLEEIFKELFSRRFENVEIKISFKATLSIENIRDLVNDPDKLEGYADFFEGLFSNLHKIRVKADPDRKSGVTCRLAATPTHVVPGSYTSLDGKIIAQFYKKLDALGRSHRYRHFDTFGQVRMLIERMFEQAYLAESKAARTTCSGGDCNFAFDKDAYMHICHRMLFLNNDEYIDAIVGDENNWDKRLAENSSIDFIKKFYTPHIENDYDMIRTMYLLRGYHDFIKSRQEFAYILIKELAFAGQLNPLYLYNDLWAQMFSFFLATSFTCPAEALIVNGRLNTIPISIIRAFGNGLFQFSIEDYVKRYRNRVKKYTGRG